MGYLFFDVGERNFLRKYFKFIIWDMKTYRAVEFILNFDDLSLKTSNSFELS